MKPKSALLKSEVLLAVHHSCCSKDLEFHHFMDTAGKAVWQEEPLPKHWDCTLFLCSLSNTRHAFAGEPPQSDHLLSLLLVRQQPRTDSNG